MWKRPSRRWVEDASVNHVPVTTGGKGKAALRAFHGDVFIGSWPDDLSAGKRANSPHQSLAGDDDGLAASTSKSSRGTSAPNRKGRGDL